VKNNKISTEDSLYHITFTAHLYWRDKDFVLQDFCPVGIHKQEAGGVCGIIVKELPKQHKLKLKFEGTVTIKKFRHIMMRKKN